LAWNFDDKGKDLDSPVKGEKSQSDQGYLFDESTNLPKHVTDFTRYFSQFFSQDASFSSQILSFKAKKSTPLEV
jgi:hypothetical protein